MDIAGSTISKRTLFTPDDFSGLKRTKPLNTTFDPLEMRGLHRTKPLNTNLASDKPILRTKLLPEDLDGRTAKHNSLSRHEQLVKQTEKLVSQAFFGTMLKQMRESPFKSNLFDGGRGGQAFGAMYDQELADRMAKGAGAKLVNSIVKHIEERADKDQQQSDVPAAMQARAQQEQQRLQFPVDVKARAASATSAAIRVQQQLKFQTEIK